MSRKPIKRTSVARARKKRGSRTSKTSSTKVKKESVSKAYLEKQLDIEWSKYIHGRDKVCQKCGGTGGLSAHHAFGRRHMATRWDVNNGTLLCYPHHLHWAHRDCGGYMDWFQKKIGEAQYLRLAEAHNQIVKHSTDDLKTMLEFFRNPC